MAADPTLIPDPSDSANAVLSRFNDTGFRPDEVVALLASLVCPFFNGRLAHGSSHSHSIATSTFIQPGAQFDCTPDKFDTQFFAEVQANATCPAGIPNNFSRIRINSDTALARDPRTNETWQSFINDQTKMANAFRDAMAKLAVTGQNTSNMTDCSAVIPTPKFSPTAVDQGPIRSLLSGLLRNE